jgi:beta-glucosidase
LRNEWKYEGIVVSDWGAISNRADSILAGCDLEMPSSLGYQTNKVIQASQYDEKLRNAVDDSANRMLNFISKYHQNFHQTYDVDVHHQAARQIARESMVLLKNEGLLPLNRNDKVAMIGGFAFDMRYQGGGSSHINPNKLEQLIEIDKNYSDQIIFSKGYGIKNNHEDDIHLKHAIKVAKDVDKVVLFVGLPDSKETEGFDRNTLDIPESQIRLINEISKVNSNVIVVAIAGSVINLSFEDKAKSILMAYLGGQASAPAIMDLLYGIENPSGKIAETFIDDVKSCNVQLNDDNNSIYYDESIFIGYRYYNTFNKKVRYPFGYGLSYTSFEYSNFEIQETDEEYVLSMEIKNTGTQK